MKDALSLELSKDYKASDKIGLYITIIYHFINTHSTKSIYVFDMDQLKWRSYIKKKKQAGAELCQAQASSG